jgi:CheY-like chemotaxis protein
MILLNTKFLLIEDDSFLRCELIASLSNLDFTGPFAEACDGQEAIKLIKSAHSNPFDFIICDVYMPNMDGISFLSQLKEEQILDVPTPILMLTVENDRNVVVECLKLRASDYLLKPWSQTELAKKIVRAWEKVHPSVVDL